MTDGYPPPPQQTTSDGSPPFDPFMLEPQKAHNSTGTAPPPMQRSGRRGMRIPGPLLGLLLALAVAVPTVVATLPAGQDASDESGGAVESPAQTESDQAEPPTTDPGGWLPAVEDCVVSLPHLRASCEILLREQPRAAAHYLDCRGLGLPADRCLAAVPRR